VNNQTVVVGKTRINTCFTIFIFVKLITIYNTVLNEGIFDAYDSVSDDQWVAAYTNKMREANGQLMNKLESNPNYVFVLNKNMVHDECGNPNKCETNTYDFVKSRLEEGKTNYYPVAGFMFYHNTFTPVEHWWVYNKSNNKFIDTSPLSGDYPRCYAGIINYNINEEIINSNQVFDVDFFKSGFSKFA